jgi:hypothetical protein
MAGGKAVAVWAIRAGKVEIEPFARLPPADARALGVEAREVLRFLADTPPQPVP